MSAYKIPLALSFALCLYGQGMAPALADPPPSPRAIANTSHEDLLICYQSLGKRTEQEAEHKWLVQQNPGRAELHFNYGYFLQHGNNNTLAAHEYKKAADLEPSSVTYVGTYGEMALFLHHYPEAYNYLGRAVQMPGGEKYKNAFEGGKVLLQNQRQQEALQQGHPKLKPGAPPAGGSKHHDDDDD